MPEPTKRTDPSKEPWWGAVSQSDRDLLLCEYRGESYLGKSARQMREACDDVRLHAKRAFEPDTKEA
jgi:hypothetical protein